MSINVISNATNSSAATPPVANDTNVSQNWIEAVAMAVKVLVDLNFLAQIATAGEVFAFMNAYIPKSAAYSSLLTTDAILAFEAKLAVNADNPQLAAASAAADAKYSSDSQAMDKELDKLNSLIQTAKTRMKQENDANDKLFQMEDPFNQLLKMLVAAIVGWKF